MRIAIDGQLMVGNKTGMGMYSYNILRYWEKGKDEIIIYVPEPLPAHYQSIMDEKGFKVKILHKSNYFIWEQIILPRAVKKDKVDLLWCPYITAPIFPPCPISVVIHDTIYMEVKLKSAPTLYKKMGLIYRRLTAPIAAKKAISVATVSEYAKRQVCKFFPVVKNKIFVVPSGIDPSEGLNSIEKCKFFAANNIDEKYILGFGSLEKRKNSIRLIKAFERLDNEIKKKYKLVLFGFRGYKESIDKKYIEEHNLVNSVIPLGYVSDKEKRTLYESCSVFVFPSLSEGFGLPVIEAYAAQVPVITSNTTSLPEVAGDGALLVNPKNVSEISSSISKILLNEELATKLICQGKRQFQKYRWEYSSAKMQKLIHSFEVTK